MSRQPDVFDNALGCSRIRQRQDLMPTFAIVSARLISARAAAYAPIA